MQWILGTLRGTTLSSWSADLRVPFCRSEHEGGKGEQRKRHVAMPAGPGTDLVLIETNLLLASLKISSMVHRAPIARMTWLSGVSVGA